MLAIIVIYDCGIQNEWNDNMLLMCTTITALRWKKGTVLIDRTSSIVSSFVQYMLVGIPGMCQAQY